MSGCCIGLPRDLLRHTSFDHRVDAAYKDGLRSQTGHQDILRFKVTDQIEHTGISVMAFLMFFFAAMAFAAALVFRWYAKRYRMIDNYRS